MYFNNFEVPNLMQEIPNYHSPYTIRDVSFIKKKVNLNRYKVNCHLNLCIALNTCYKNIFYYLKFIGIHKVCYKISLTNLIYKQINYLEILTTKYNVK